MHTLISEQVTDGLYSKYKGSPQPSGKSHAHKIQAAVAMDQRAKEMGKSSQAAVYRKYINQMKKKTKMAGIK